MLAGRITVAARKFVRYSELRSLFALSEGAEAAPHYAPPRLAQKVVRPALSSQEMWFAKGLRGK